MIEMVDLKKLRLRKRNPRTITSAQMKKCMDKIQSKPEFLQENPILVNVLDGVYNVYCGNQRVRAARKLGWKQIPCSLSYNLSEEDVKERVVLHNTHFGENDYEMLACDYDIELLLSCGLTEQELQIDDPTIEDIGEEESSEQQEEQIKYCPHCDGIL